MITIAICDDNAAHIEKIKKITLKALKRYETEFACFESSASLLDSIEKDRYSPNIALLDINMDGMNGISLAMHINELLPECKIIFLSAYISYAQDVYNAEHVWFVLKKDMESRLPTALSKAVSQIRQRPTEKSILIKTDAGQMIVSEQEILFIDRLNFRTRIVCTEATLYSNKTPQSILGEDNSFIRCHQSIWVNPVHIKALDKDEFILDNDMRIAISRTYRSSARETFFREI